MKKIALVGNMNNNFYALTRYLRDAGYDAHLFYRLAMQHFQPEADSYTDEYKTYCHCVDWLDNAFHNVDKKKVKQQLAGFDFYIGQGEEAAVAYLCGYKINVYYPYGSDVYKYATLPHEYTIVNKLVSLVSNDKARPTYTQMKEGTMAKYLNAAIVNADYLFADVTNVEFEQKLNALNYKGIYRNIPLPFVYVHEYEKLNQSYIPDSSVADVINDIRSKHNFIILYHGRQEWKTYHNQFTGKNTHHLIQGFAKYIRQTPDFKGCLVMLEYGSDVEASKELIVALGIEAYVYWLPKMYRKELMYVIKNVDVCSGEFGYSYLTFGTVVEAMLMQKPVITHRQDDLYTGTYPNLYPCYNAREPEAICDEIAIAVTNTAKRLQMGVEAKEWIMNYFIKRPFNELLTVIENAIQKN